MATGRWPPWLRARRKKMDLADNKSGTFDKRCSNSSQPKLKRFRELLMGVQEIKPGRVS